MAARALKLIYSKCKLGHSLSQVSELTELTIGQLKEILGQATGITPADLSIILLMTQRGLTLEQISQECDVALEVLKLFLPEVIQETVATQIDADHGKGPCEISRILGVRERAVKAYTLDCKYYTFLYSCQQRTNHLYRVNLLTGEESSLEVPHYQFKDGCCWSELPGGSLLITGGYPVGKDVVKIDTLREYAVSSQPHMHTARMGHAAVYYSQYVYVLGGIGGRSLRECERYSCAESRWEVLPALPVAGAWMSGVEVENSVYALGGSDGRDLDTVQKLSLDSLTWQLMQFKLPQAASSFPCFKSETQVYLVIKETLYSFTLLEIKAVKTLDTRIWGYSSYYSRGTLYYECGGIRSLALKLG
jgi:hypothetical protein